MRHPLAALSVPVLLAACGGRVVLGDLSSTEAPSRATDGGGLEDATLADADFDSNGGACSLVGGTWDVTQDSLDGTNASVEFLSDGTFIGGAAGAALPTGEIYSGTEVSRTTRLCTVESRTKP